MKVSITTLGCKVNQFESQAFETLLSERGHVIVSDNAEACIINSCAVTSESARKSKQAMRSAREQNPGAVVGVCGCMSQLEPDNALLAGADLVYGSADKTGFLAALEELYNDRRRAVHELHLQGFPQIVKVDDLREGMEFERMPAGTLSGRTRAYLKVQDGCSNRCAYCVIPYSRGAVRSLPLCEAVGEAKKLSGLGIKEIIVTGIEIASYGKDLNDGSGGLAELICAVSKAVPEVRVRVGSLEPRIVTQDFVSKLRQCENIMPHFHLSLQSGCDEVLRRMRRAYTTEHFYNSVTLLRKAYPDCGLSADLIVGFPGESEFEFDKTMDFIRKCSFSSMHIFPFSSRRGTAAASMQGQISKLAKKERAKQAASAASEMKEAFLRNCIGSRQDVLFERSGGGKSRGHAGNNALVEYGGHIDAGEIRTLYIRGAGNGKLFV